MRALVAALAVLAASPALAQEVAPPPAPVAATPAPTGDWRTVAPDNLLVIETSKGLVYVELSPQAAPNHVERIRLLTRRGFYNGLNFHRVIDWFMAQTGDPLGNGEGQSPYPDLTAEFTFRRGPDLPFAPVSQPQGAQLGFIGSLPVETQPDALMGHTGDGKVHAWGVYCSGVGGMARGEDNDSANSQFFLMRQAYPSLDKRYTVWGRVVAGLDVVRALKFSPTPDGLVAEAPDRMTRVRLASDMPEAERPTVQVLDTASARFQTLIAEVRQARGADFSICDIELPAQVTAGQRAA